MKLTQLVLFFVSIISLTFSTTVIVTTKITFADSVVARVISEIYGYPIIFLDKNNLTSDDIAELKYFNAIQVIIIGGPAVISDNVENKLKELGYEVVRLWGVTRYETSAIVAKFFWDNVSEVVLITRELTNENIDIKRIALLRRAIEYAIAKEIPILITPPGNLDQSVADTLISLGVSKVSIFTTIPTLKNSNLAKQLEELGIKFEVKNYFNYKEYCKNVTKVFIPLNESWKNIRYLIIGYRCLEIIPINNTNISTIKNLERIKNIIKHWMKYMYKNKTTTNITTIFKRRVYSLLDSIQFDLIFLESICNKTRNSKVCNLTLKFSNLTSEVENLIEEGKYREAIRTLLKSMSLLKLVKWKLKLYRLEMRLKHINDILHRIEEKYKRLVGNKSKEIRIRHKMPNLDRIKELAKLVRTRIRNKSRIYCIQVIVRACNPLTGECRTFPNPCEVPKGWKILKPSSKSSEEKVQTNITNPVQQIPHPPRIPENYNITIK